ncbi:ABC transporter A family member 9-like isoform X2 [Dysidea avara]|uniref:ABC transporter A family member 9-like isoform X2 n=1 Tax=Dysidea avara TaxID=196820 RepID=UPI003327EEC1
MMEESGGTPRAVKAYADKVRVWHQMRALFLKDLTLRRRAYGTTLCQLLVPVVLLGIAGLFQVIANAILASSRPTVPGTDRPSFPMDASWMLSCTRNETHHPERCLIDPINIIYYVQEGGNRNAFNDTFTWVPYDLSIYVKDCLFEDPSQLPAIIGNLTSDIELLPQFALYNIPMIYYVDNGGSDQNLGNLSRNGSADGFLGKALPSPGRYNFTLDFVINPIWNNVCYVDNAKYEEEPTIQLPYFAPLNSPKELHDRLVQVSNSYTSLSGGGFQIEDQYSRNYEAFPTNQKIYKQVLSWIIDDNYTRVKPYAGVLFDEVSLSSLQYTLVVPDVLYYDNLAQISCKNGTSNSSQPNCLQAFVKLLANSEVPRTQSMINLLHNAYLRNSTNNMDTSTSMIEMFLSALPSKKIELQIDVASILGAILYPFATSFLLPVFIATLVKDKREKHLIMMQQNGLSRPVYWIISYCFDYMFYMLVILIVVAISFAFQIRLFTQTNFLILFFVFSFWGHALVVLGFFFSNIFQRPRTATVVGYLIVIIGVIVSQLLSGLNIFAVDETPPFFIMMYPPFAYYRVLFYLNNACVEFRCFGTDHLGWGSQEAALYSDGIMYLFFGSLMFGLLFVYLSYIFPGEFGIRKPFHFPITDPIKYFTGRDIMRRNHDNSKHHRLPSVTNSSDEDIRDSTSLHYEVEEVDEDVKAEADAIDDAFTTGYNVSIVMSQLRKEFPASAGKPIHIAVHGMSLAIQRNECFGLLGPNGAGKTTLISLLTGLYEPTSGTARVAGYDLATEISSVHQHIGVCPQFDIQHESLTAKEHLLFYGRLRGLKWGHEKHVVEHALRQVNLLDAANKKSKQLSGGMRRRLSVAMACVGSPDILILDEPTTGLDPAARRQVWEVINNVKQNKCVILTTHAMEEADHLCTRIGIMNYGKLRCLGSQNRLKTKFGIGYQLQINCPPSKVEDVEHFMAAKLPQVVHVETYNGKISYKIDKDQLVVSELFAVLNSVKVQLGIADWGIKRTTLEDVFLTIVAKHHDQRTPLSSRTWLSWLPYQSCTRKSTVE